MQKSNTFVLYKKVANHQPQGNTWVYNYLKQASNREGPQDLSTADLREAVITDKAIAFKWAVTQDGGPWAVGELVSDAKGVRVEE